MIDIVVGYDKDQGMYKVYEPSTDTLFVTTSLGDSFLKLSAFLKQQKMIATDLLGADDIRYHIDSATFLAMIESNVNLLKRLNQAPSGFMISGQRLGQPQSSLQSQIQKKKGGYSSSNSKNKKFKSGSFSKSSFSNSYKKFGGYAQ